MRSGFHGFGSCSEGLGGAIQSKEVNTFLRLLKGRGDSPAVDLGEKVLVDVFAVVVYFFHD
jgi:hypothetical protein